MKKLFVDMDGVLCRFEEGASLEEITSEGFFISRTPHINLIRAINTIIELKRAEVYILSSVFVDEHSEKEKNLWLDKYGLSIIPKKNRLFVPYGKCKSEFLREKNIFDEKDFLLDDFSRNLHSWHGIGIKLYNGINGNNGTWRGYSINLNAKEEVLKNTLCGILEYA